MAKSKKIDKLLAKMEEMIELQQRAFAEGDSDTLHKYTREYLEFVTLHQKTLNVSDELIANLRRAVEKGDKLREKVKKISGELEKVKEIYHDRLLELPPQGKKRTEH